VILVELELRNYKQFYGVHHFTPPSQGIVGIIGRNGSGKTTLFEAIEWCLYAPRSIGRDEIPTRGRSGNPSVKLVLEEPESGLRYVIERSLKGGASKTQSAEIYREDQPESRIIHGSAATRAYVASKLIGLGHTAFVSTFFTRQKELSFFGSLSNLERRREIERLLGFETIRQAQQSLSEDRNKANNEAVFLRAQHEQEMERHNLVEERQRATELLAAAQGVHASAIIALEAAKAQVVNARKERERLQGLQQRDNELTTVLTRVEGSLHANQTKRDGLVASLQQITVAREEHERLLPIAEQVEALELRLKIHEREAERHREARQIEERLSGCGISLDQIEQQVARAVRTTLAPFVPEWTWTPVPHDELPAAIDRLIGIVDALNIDETCARAVDLETALERQHHHHQAAAKVVQYRQRLDSLRSQQAQMLKEHGDPAERSSAASRARDLAQRTISEAAANIKHVTDRLAEITDTIELLQAERKEDRCPTCGQTIDLNQRRIILDSLGTQASHLEKERQSARAAKQRAETEASSADAALTEAEAQRAQLTELAGRIANGESMLPGVDEEEHGAALRLQAILGALGMTSPPDAATVQRFKSEASALQLIQQQVPLLRNQRAQAAEQLEKRDRAKLEREALGPVAYEAEAHREDLTRYDAARDAATTVIELSRQISREGDVQADLQQIDASVATCKEEIESLTRQRAELKFDREALAKADEAERQTHDAERSAIAAVHQASTTVAESENRLKWIEQEEARLAQMLVDADEKQRLADDLTMMYRSFERFGGYVSRTVTPDLAEHTSALIDEATDSKYDRIEFDESFAIQVFDGDESFPMEHFSGGERDVIALSARLALSKLIGDQATHPPRFLVLDEVFGSLDRERRENVLSTLGRVVTATEVFQQLFVITHVDDVRSSPIFDQIWRVNESADGVSDLRDITDDTRYGEDL
jgi:DNA repair protein SbcC/Rad50